MITVCEKYYELKINDNVYYLEPETVFILELTHIFSSIFDYRKNDVWNKKVFKWNSLIETLNVEVERLNEEEFIITINDQKMPFNVCDLSGEYIEDIKRDRDKFKGNSIKELIDAAIEILGERLKEFKKEYDIE